MVLRFSRTAGPHKSSGGARGNSPRRSPARVETPDTHPCMPAGTFGLFVGLAGSLLLKDH
jgi:hypothetical protein